MKKNGFTLIELMVVVVIIAILSAVAVPEYLKSLEKSRASEAVTYTRAISKALANYYSERGNCYVEITDLPLELAYNSSDAGKIYTDRFSYSINGTHCSVAAGRITPKTNAAYIIKTTTLDAPLDGVDRKFLGATVCLADTDDTEASSTCAYLTSNDKLACPSSWSEKVCYLF